MKDRLTRTLPLFALAQTTADALDGMALDLTAEDQAELLRALDRMAVQLEDITEALQQLLDRLGISLGPVIAREPR